MTKIINMFIVFINDEISTTSDDISKENSIFNGSRLSPNNPHPRMDESLMQQFTALNIGSRDTNNIRQHDYPIGVWDNSEFNNTHVDNDENQYTRNMTPEGNETRESRNMTGARAKTHKFNHRYSEKSNEKNKGSKIETNFLHDSDNFSYGVENLKDNEMGKHEKEPLLKKIPPQQCNYIREEERNRRLDIPIEKGSPQIWKGARPKTRFNNTKHRRHSVFIQPVKPEIYKPTYSSDDLLYNQSIRQGLIAENPRGKTDTTNIASNSLLPQVDTTCNQYYSNTSSSSTELPDHKNSHCDQRIITPHYQLPDESYNVNPNIHSTNTRCYESSYTQPTYQKSEYVDPYFWTIPRHYPNTSPFLMNESPSYDFIDYIKNISQSYCNNDMSEGKFSDLGESTSNSYMSSHIGENQNTYPQSNNEVNMVDPIKENFHYNPYINQYQVIDTSTYELDKQNINETPEYKMSHTMGDILENTIYKDIYEKRIYSETNERSSKEIETVIDELREKLVYNIRSFRLRSETKLQTFSITSNITHMLIDSKDIGELKHNHNFQKLVLSLINRKKEIDLYMSKFEISKRKLFSEIYLNLGKYDLYNNMEFLQLVSANKNFIGNIFMVCVKERKQITDCLDMANVRGMNDLS